MTDLRKLLETPMNGLKKPSWLGKLQEIADDTGFFEPLGKNHFATFVDQDETLIVTFESIQGIQALSEAAQPMGWEVARERGWSHLALISDGDTWFRDPAVFAFFDKFIDDGFFEEFDRVVFYGAGPCGYAATAFSVASPGATVLAVQPQATLDPRITEWDDRFMEMRRTDFGDRYGFAPDMVDAAEQAFVFYDPHEDLDAMHAALFTRPNVTKLRMPNMGDALQTELLTMDLLFTVLSQAGQGSFSAQNFAKLYRARRNNGSYLRGLLARLDVQDRPYLATMLCRNVVGRMHAPRIRRRLDALERAAAEGKIQIPAA
ncbi:phosphoadenosine phosphosulfate reductase [Thalassovita sp.]|uniref:phosphoadenosine phosphosulfate reductase n=1 Tax=Thalassovita sp. TaxID=1979401 RepID=UPI0029DE5309|nr:phosphoadenosine phosphosulfate reductase [Thalassovita sp.]